MRRLLVSICALLLLSTHAFAQNNANTTANSNAAAATGARTTANSNRRRGPVFRASKDQINQAQTILKQRGLYTGEATGKLDPATRAALRKYQEAERLKVTGTLNRATLEKMSIALTERQRAM